ncbi:MAG: holo-ACP synthase [Smithellaceae bacterium]|jgi:holo-[acyl-carrier protein] synthase|nr:holo-ACP synthase [Syntrophaceae bacterium]MDX9816119.1 holo-ACP synthase [Smithellaceae bacterium]OPZ52515.1 MAG: Holo-(acyl-carrier-protein) synthase [Deltaproteobacteria bacterium ADurb.BinA014]MBP8609295.1 holo-ACP synthase [Syntrophaceae bacterium]HOM69913.1 holo-ACP synthase [Smithellaceae bacterium]
MIHGIGIDLVENDRIEKVIRKWGCKFLNRVFCDREVEYCAKHVHNAPHYAARFAAKESFLKALGMGLGMGVKMKDIEVTRGGDGKPEIVVHDGAKNQIDKNKITRIHLSLTHTENYAAAFLVLEKEKELY